MRNDDANSERGSGLVLVALSLGLVVVMSLLLVLVTERVVDRSHAQSAADAAALAGAAGGESEAVAFAQENGATLLSFSSNGSEVSVRIELDGVVAHANAKRSLVLDRGR